MRSNGKLLWVAAYAALLLLATGCGGFQATKTVSPLDFILPGLLQVNPPPAPSDPAVPAAAEPVKQIAQN